LGLPAINIGTRQNSRCRGKNVIDVAYNRKKIVSAMKKLNGKVKISKSTMYGKGDAGKQIAKLLATLPLNYCKTITY
jgi:UDP-N-acetylglucosamine 2-epimerase